MRSWSTEFGLNDGMIFLRRCFQNECFEYTFDGIARKIHGPNVIARLEKDFCLFKPLMRHTIELSRNRPCWCTHLMRSRVLLCKDLTGESGQRFEQSLGLAQVRRV